MKSQADAFDEAYSSLRMLGIPEILPALHAAGVGISRTVLGGSHSVAVYPPVDSLTPIDPQCILNDINTGSEASLYVHIAFCETRCTFCHYAVDYYPGRRDSSVADGKVARYLDALKLDLVHWGAQLAKSGSVLSSVYIGGGTPLILEQESLSDIINTIQSEFDILPGAEVCIEASPLTITAPDGEDKLRFLKERGVTRLSFGVQSFDDTVLKYAARGYKRNVPIRASTIAGKVFENWNLDLIQGLYKGSPSEVWQNLEVIAEILPTHVTWYHGRFADRPQKDWYEIESKRACFENEEETLLGRTLIWQGLTSLGYHQTDGNRFVRERRYTDPFKKMRTSVSSNLIGVGAASYSHAGSSGADPDNRGYVFRNEPDIRSYEDCVLNGRTPIATGRAIDEEELLATSYATGLRSGRIENQELSLIRRRKLQLSQYYENLVRKLSILGVLESFADSNGIAGLRLSTLGRLFEDETLGLFFSPAVKQTLAR